MGISNTFGTIPGIVSPLLTGYLVVEQTTEEWKIVFFISAGIYLIGCLIYWFWASGEIQEWAKLSNQQDATINHRPNNVGYVNDGVTINDETS